MDTRPESPQKLDPLRRVFVPIERRESNGESSFTTVDGVRYRRGVDGAIRRSSGVKGQGKASRKARGRAKKLAASRIDGEKTV